MTNTANKTANKTAQIKAIRGMNDILPADSPLWLRVEGVCQQVFSRYHYAQIRTPLLESTHLFARSIGADTDIVSKEMYTFEDRNGDSLTLRPEGTASCVRAGIENGLFYNQQQRLWYVGPMFRHERPQKGRYRQFYQIGAEVYGWQSPDIEAEMLGMLQQIFTQLGLRNTELQINSLGDSQARASYRAALVEYLSQYREQLDEDSQRRLGSNPLRILDSKNPQVQAIVSDAPSILDFLSEQSRDNFTALQTYLNDLGIEFTINHRLVRGLDYYNDTVFEWVNKDFGAQSTVCGGGRYDRMVEQLGGQPTPGFGFAMGVERLVQMLQEQGDELAEIDAAAQVFIISVGATARRHALKLQQQLTQHGLHVQCHMGDGSIKNQFKRADKSLARIGVIIGEDEAQQSQASIKLLRRDDVANMQDFSQQVIPQNDVFNVVTNLLESL